MAKLELPWEELLLTAEELELLDTEIALLKAIGILDEFIDEPAETAELPELFDELIDKLELFEAELDDKLEAAGKSDEESLPPQA